TSFQGASRAATTGSPEVTLSCAITVLVQWARSAATQQRFPLASHDPTSIPTRHPLGASGDWPSRYTLPSSPAPGALQTARLSPGTSCRPPLDEPQNLQLAIKPLVFVERTGNQHLITDSF